MCESQICMLRNQSRGHLGSVQKERLTSLLLAIPLLCEEKYNLDHFCLNLQFRLTSFDTIVLSCSALLTTS